MNKTDLKYLVSLKSGKNKHQSKQFIVEGKNHINILLKYFPTKVEHIFINKKKTLEFQNLLEPMDKQKISFMNNLFFDRVSQFKTPSSILALVTFFQEKPPPKEMNNWAIILENIQDPGNFGTIIRTAHWYGINNIFLIGSAPDRYNHKVIHASAGAIFSTSLFYTSLKKIKELYPKKPIIVTDIKTKNHYHQWNKEKGFICFGNEGKGISSKLKSISNDSIGIRGNKNSLVDSLNVTASVAIVLDKIFNQTT